MSRRPAAAGTVSVRQRLQDEAMMRRCLELARRAEGRTAPNPMVGCVIVDRRGRVVAEGHHRGPGRAHAEIDALAKVGGKARGATLYVNLEPCNHQGRTPPCAPAVARSGVARVVIGMRDPVRGHGGGARLLGRAPGVAVEIGLLEDECRALNRGFVMLAQKGRPAVTLKVASTLDGAVATARGESQWITSVAARRDGHRLRDRLDALIVGVGTVLADDPRLTCRIPGGRDPVRVVVDSKLRTPPGAALLPAATRSPARTIIATTDAAGEARARTLAQRGAEIWRLGTAAGRVDLDELLERLGQAGLTTALVEGGPTLLRGFVDARLADELVVYLAPRAVAGGRPWLGGPPIGRLGEAVELEIAAPPEQIGPDLKLILAPRRGPRRP